MRLTSEEWARLTTMERSRLVRLERADKNSGRVGGSPFLPDDCGECGFCSSPSLGGGLCLTCSRELTALINKAKGGRP